MVIVAKLIVERTEPTFNNKHFFGNVKKSQKYEETTIFDKVENVTLPDFDKVQIKFSQGSNEYKVTIDKYLFDYHDGENTFTCEFTNAEGNIFELTIFEDKSTSLKLYYSKSEYDDDESYLDIVTDIMYDNNIK